jgi:hypothetical protein
MSIPFSDLIAQIPESVTNQIIDFIKTYEPTVRQVEGFIIELLNQLPELTPHNYFGQISVGYIITKADNEESRCVPRKRICIEERVDDCSCGDPYCDMCDESGKTILSRYYYSDGFIRNG